MRVSVNRDDPGYDAYASLRARRLSPRIVLDGVEQRHVITADEASGTVLRHVLNADGQPQIDPSNPEEVWVEEVSGVVEVLLSEG